MNFRTPVPRLVPIVLAIPEHAGQRGQAHALNIPTGIQRGLDVHDNLWPLDAGEAKRAGDTGAIQQGINNKSVALSLAGFQPKFRKAGKFLGNGQSRIDRHPSGRQAILIQLPRATEIRSPEKSHPIGGGSRTLLQTKTGEAQIVREGLPQTAPAKSEVVRTVEDFTGLPLIQHMDLHRVFKIAAEMKELNGKIETAILAQTQFTFIDDLLKRVIVDRFQERLMTGHRLLIGLRGHAAGMPL